jgi:hypothetical protein
MKCFDCGKELEKCEHGIIYGGLWCRSYGNYGSTLYDPLSDFSNEYLEFVICDDCMKLKADRVQWKRTHTEVEIVAKKSFKKYLDDETKELEERRRLQEEEND